MLMNCFKPQDRKNGEDLYRKGSVRTGSCSDTEVHCYLSSPGSHRVKLSSDGLTSSVIYTNCSCSSGKKGRLCKHVWATIIELDSQGADFLAEKTEVEPGSAQPESEAVLAAKARQLAYQKQIREKIKAQKKQKLKKPKNEIDAKKVVYPTKIEEAIQYFTSNGIDITKNLDVESIGGARKKLAMVFHPDKGGTHEEILRLNKYYEILTKYFR